MNTDFETEQRIVGIEMEYTPLFKGSKGVNNIVGDAQRKAMLDGLPESIAMYPLVTNSHNLNFFIQNGGRYYRDVHGVLEYATPECLSFREAVIYDMAGEQMLIEHLSSDPVKRALRDLHSFKRVSDYEQNPNTSGAHENYSSNIININEDFKPHGVGVMGLGSHLITRSIFSGAGSVDHDGVFHKTQKLRNIEDVVNPATSAGRKPLVNTRDESFGTGSRIHIICGDPNISPWATWMKLGTTSLVLRLIECDQFPEDALIAPEKLLESAVAIGSTASLDTTITNSQGKQLTAFDVQEIICEAASKLGGKIDLPAEEYEIISEWKRVIRDLRNDTVSCLDRIDWLVNQYAVDSAQGKTKEETDYIRRKRDLGYAMLLPVIGSGPRKRQDGVFRMTPTPDEVIYARNNPPKDTRAVVRAKVVRVFNNNKIDGTIDWNEVRMSNVTNSLWMKDVRDTDTTDFEEWFERYAA